MIAAKYIVTESVFYNLLYKLSYWQLSLELDQKKVGGAYLVCHKIIDLYHKHKVDAI